MMPSRYILIEGERQINSVGKMVPNVREGGKVLRAGRQANFMFQMG